MLKLLFDKPKESLLNILFLGAHSDDIEIGCGGTLLRLADGYPNLTVTWVVFSAIGARAVEAQKSAEDFLKNVQKKQILLKKFKDGYFPSSAASIKDIFEDLKKDLLPDVIFTHYRNDLHQDHRQLNELTWNTWRNHLILEYEIPKYDGDLGNTNFFVTLDDEHRKKKIDLLLNHFQTQANKHWFSAETFNGLMRMRGVECKSVSGYAEAFFCRKISF
jgi:LmbE family N-acetylglucosaminyl deacetylase